MNFTFIKWSRFYWTAIIVLLLFAIPVPFVTGQIQFTVIDFFSVVGLLLAGFAWWGGGIYLALSLPVLLWIKFKAKR